MAKPTTTIRLPDFPVTIVRKLAGNFIHDEINLKEMVANTDKGLILYFYPQRQHARLYHTGNRIYLASS